MGWVQREMTLQPMARGCHLVTDLVVDQLPELRQTEQGLLHLFLLHTSASLTINENADLDVPRDLEMALSRIAPEDFPYRHTAEGPDDMPAHVKTALVGHELTIPVHKGRLVLGSWQGIYLWEHRHHPSARRIMASLIRP